MKNNSNPRTAILFTLTLVLVLSTVGSPSIVVGAAPTAPTGLLCELSSNPLGIEDLTPELGWVVNDPDKDETQTAYQVLVASSLTNLNGNIGDLWDSGKVASGESSNVSYAGTALAAGSVYYWKVRTWDKSDAVSPYSSSQMIVTALGSGWTATPIWSSAGNFAYLRKQVTLPSKTIDKAIAFVTGRSTASSRQYVFRLYINGSLIGVGPARGFNSKVPYNVFDVTGKLTAGTANVIAAACYSYDSSKDFLLQMKINYTDGTSETIVTDGTWKAKDVSNIYNMSTYYTSYYKAGNENIDARNIPYGWNNTGYNDSSWAAAGAKTAYTSSLVAQPMRNMEIVEQAPISVVNKGGGNFFFDFGKEIVAGIKLTINGTVGTVTYVRLGEEISGTNTVKYQARTGVTYNDAWTLKAGTQTIENFGYRGFRFGEIVGSPDTTLDSTKIKALVLRYPFDDTAGTFTSSNATLNEVWDLCKYSIKATSLDVYQDCPTRERGPYEGDAYINQLSHYGMDREYPLARYSGEYLYYNSTWPTEYKQTSVLEAWVDYMATGNKDSLSQYYTKLKTKTLESYLNANNLVEKSTTDDLVDWPSGYRDGYVFTTINTVINAFNYKAIEYLGKIADVLGATADRDTYNTKAANIKNAMNTYLYDNANGRYYDGQTSTHAAVHASMFPLAFGITTDTKKTATASYIKSRGMVCGVYGSQYILEALYAANEGDFALGLMTATGTNSWYHMIHGLNATIVTEAWDPAGKSNMSFAHAWASAPGNMVPRGMFGIDPLEAGYKKIAVKPQTGSLTSASINLPTIKGTVHVDISKTSSNYTININNPANSTTKVYVPSFNLAGTAVTVDGVSQNGTWENGYVIFDNIGSGAHSFVRSLTGSTATPMPTPTTGPTSTPTPTATPSNNLALNKTVSAFSSYEQSGWGKAKAVDGERSAISGAKGWTSANSLTVNHTEWVSVDLAASYSINKVDLYPRNDGADTGYGFPIDFTIQVSTDNTNWTTVITRTGYTLPGGTVQSFSFSNQNARYVKIEGTSLRQNPNDSNQYRMQFAEIEVYAPAGATATPTPTPTATPTPTPAGTATPTPTPGGSLLTDDFSGDLSKWTAVSNCAIETGELSLNNSGYIESVSGSGWTNYTLECDVNIKAVAAGINFRVVDGNNYYMWQLSNSTNKLRLHKKVSGTFSVFKEVTSTFNLNTVYHVKIVASGSTISTYVGGNLIDTTTDTAFSAGKVGFRQGSTEHAHVDNVNVY